MVRSKLPLLRAKSRKDVEKLKIESAEPKSKIANDNKLRKEVEFICFVVQKSHVRLDVYMTYVLGTKFGFAHRFFLSDSRPDSGLEL